MATKRPSALLAALAIAVVFIGVFAAPLGLLIPGFVRHTADNWRTWLAVRVAIQLGGPLSVALVAWIALDAARSARVLARYAAVALVAALPFCYAPLLDALVGPVRVDGALVADHGPAHQTYRHTRYQDIEVRDATGNGYACTVRGLQVSHWLALAPSCHVAGAQVHLEALRFEGLPIALGCGGRD